MIEENAGIGKVKRFLLRGGAQPRSSNDSGYPAESSERSN